jgi:hypothetical protein
MALRNVDAAQCFTLISDNVPTWITRISELAQHTVARHAEFVDEYKRLTPQRPRHRRNSSLCSIQPISTEGFEITPDTKRDTKVPDSADNDNSQVDVKPNPLKRTNAEVSSSTSIVPPAPTRMRHNLVIHYDGHTQQELERVVRDIGTARNWLRKAKMSQLSKQSPFALGRRTGLLRLGAGAPVSRTVTGGPGRHFPESSPFEFVDKELEIAQSLCEGAAHQFLRCGNCTQELQNVQEKLRSILGVSTSAASRFEQEKEAEEAGEESSEESDEAVPPLIKTESESDGAKPAEPSGALEIEVDDDASDGSVDIDITAFRSTRFRV